MPPPHECTSLKISVVLCTQGSERRGDREMHVLFLVVLLHVIGNAHLSISFSMLGVKQFYHLHVRGATVFGQ